MSNYEHDDLTSEEVVAIVKRQQESEQREIEDIRHVMSTDRGRRVVWGILEKGQVFGSCFSADPYVTAFNEGQRNLALSLFQRVMSHCPEQYLTMAAEAGKQE